MIGGTRRQVLLALGAAAVTAGLAGCAADAPAEQHAVRAATRQQASVRGGTRIRLTGAGLGAATAVRVGATTVPVESAAKGEVVFAAQPFADFASGTARVELLAGTTGIATARLAYAALDGVDRQLQYLLRHWKDYNPAYQPLGTTDCVDFASQSLLARGWTQQGVWTHAEDVYRSGPAWISSTAFRDFMQEHPALGTALTDDERAKVRLGDVVQFDWDGTGDRDHTGVVTRITKDGGRIRIGFAGHTMDSDYRDVDDAITTDHPGGAAYYWSIT